MPSRITVLAISRTSASRHPPLTPPRVAPLSSTSSLAPARRYADPWIRTTVASAARRPAAASSATRSRIRDVSCQCFIGIGRNRAA